MSKKKINKHILEGNRTLAKATDIEEGREVGGCFRGDKESVALAMKYFKRAMRNKLDSTEETIVKDRLHELKQGLVCRYIANRYKNI